MLNNLKNNDSGGSTLNGIIVLIIIGLLFWQFVIPMIDDTLPIPSDYFNSEDNPITFAWYIEDINTGGLLQMPSSTTNEIYYSSTDSYRVKIITNADYQVTTEYYFEITVYTYGQTNPQYTYTEPIPISSLTTNEFNYNLGLDLTGTTTYQVYARVLNSDLVDTGELIGSVFFIPS